MTQQPTYFQRPIMPAFARFALFERPANPAVKPRVCHDAAELARAIHRRRGQRSLQLVEAKLQFRDQDDPVQGVAVWALDLASDSAAYLGWAYLDGASRAALERALFAAQPEVNSLRGAA